MPGATFQALIASAGAAALSSITQVLSATSLASTITFPSGIQAGDLIVLQDWARNISGVPSTVTPTGFTIVNDSTTSTVRGILSYKKATGSESGSLTGMSGTFGRGKAMAVFRGDVAAATVTSADPDGEATSGNPAAQTVTSGSGTPPLVAIGGYSAMAAITARTFSPAKDGEAGTSDDRVYLAWKIYNSSPADVSVDMADFFVNILQSCYIQMA